MTRSLNWKYLFKKLINLISSRRKEKSDYFAFLILLLLFPHSMFSQEIEYTVIGRVLDESGQPISKADIRVSPLKYVMEYSALTNEDGRFSINTRIKKGDIRYFYVSQDSKDFEDSENPRTLIDPPFFEVNLKNKRFLGKQIKFGEKKVVDVGDVNVQFWFNTVYLKLQVDGRNLKEKEWESLWCRLIDDKGRILAQSTIGSKVKVNNSEIDLEKSIFKLSLPEGKWKLEFQKFDWGKSKNLPKIIGQSLYFTVDRNKNADVIEVIISNLFGG